MWSSMMALAILSLTQGVMPSHDVFWRALRVGVALEGYYQYDWNKPPDRIIPLRAYDTRANVFGIQQLAVVVEVQPAVTEGRRYGIRVDLQFGQATETVQGNSANEPRPEVYRNLWQAYGTYVLPLGPRGLQADFGKFASMLGYESNYAKDNQAFSRSFLFDFLPFYHSGLRLTFPASDKVSLLYMLTNGVQQTEDFNNYKSNHFAAILKPSSSVTWTVNYYFGQEQPDGGHPGGPNGFFRVFDTYATFAPTSWVTVGFDANHTTNEVGSVRGTLALDGLAAYGRYQLTRTASAGLRYERLDDDGLFSGIRQLLHEVTLTTEFKLADGFLLRPEFRRDWSSRPYFEGPNGMADLRNQQNTLLLAGVWTVGNKQGAW
jgi:hypothetical protein